jgi:hypothetical protein
MTILVPLILVTLKLVVYTPLIVWQNLLVPLPVVIHILDVLLLQFVVVIIMLALLMVVTQKMDVTTTYEIVMITILVP